MALGEVFQRFVDQSPVTVMVRGLIERLLDPQQLDEWFEGTVENQYTRELLFSSVFDIMSQVVCGTRPSVHAAYQATEAGIGVSITSLYNKLNAMAPRTSAELVRYAAAQAAPLIEQLGGTLEAPLPGLRVKLLDGNCVEASEHRIEALRALAGGALPGKSLVTYDPRLGIPIDVFPCEDGHAQERSLLQAVLPTVAASEVWIADRNFCTRGFLSGIDARDAYCVIRQHGNLPWEPLGALRPAGKTATGVISEQWVRVIDEHGSELRLRRICVRLNNKTRDGDREIYMLTNLPKSIAKAKQIAELYRGRWTIGVSGEGHIIQSVQVRPRPTDASLVAWEVPWRESKTVKPSDHVLERSSATYQVATCSERRSSLVTRFPVAETVDNVRRQQGPCGMRPTRRPSPAGYQRRHGTKDDVSTGEALGARRRKSVEEVCPITLNGKWMGRHQGGGSGRSTDDRRAAKRAGREGPGPVGISVRLSEAGVR